MSHVYFRAMDRKDFENFDSTEELTGASSVTYWTDGREPAGFYKTAGRVIVKMTLDAPLPEHRKGIAHHSTYNHREWTIPMEEFNEFVGYNLLDLEIV